MEYANGDPKTNKWAKMRADAGHPEPFHLKMIGIGNENYGEVYLENFAIVKEALHEKYPEIKCVLCSGAFIDGKTCKTAWQLGKEKYPDVYIDEHYYRSNEWFYDQVNRYDHYERGIAKVFAGEYAANDQSVPHIPNTFESALAEAAFLTGIERNSDVVAMTSYAPLFSMIDGMQWNHNMIWFSPSEIVKTPNYYVQQMYASNIGSEYVEYMGELPEKCYLSITKDKQHYYIKFVNASNEETHVDITLEERIKDEVKVTVLHSIDQEAVNVLEYKGEPQYHVWPEDKMITGNNGNIKLEVLPYSINICVADII